MPKLNIDVNDELYNNLKKLSEQFNLPLEELMKRLLIHGSRGVIEEQILKNYPQSNISLVLPSQSSTTTGITSSSIDALFQQALELRKQELLLRMLSPTPSTQTSPNPEIEILKKEIESLKEMNKSLIDQLTKKQEENKIDKLIKLVMKVTKSNQEVIEKLTKPKEGELPADVKKTIEDLNKQNAELKEKLKELAEAQKNKALITAVKAALKKAGSMISYTFEEEMKKLREDLKKVTESGGKVDVDKLLNTVTNTYKQITTSAIESLTSTKKLLETLAPTPPTTSTTEVISHVANVVKDTAKEVVGEIRKTAEALNQEATTATPSAAPVITLPPAQPQQEQTEVTEEKQPEAEQATQQAQSQ